MMFLLSRLLLIIAGHESKGVLWGGVTPPHLKILRSQTSKDRPSFF